MLIKRFIFLILSIVLITGINCSSHLETTKAIKLSWEAQILDKERDTIFNWNGSSKLFFYQDILLYEKESIFIHSDDKQEKVYTYWIYKQNYKKGIKYKGSRQDTVGTTFDVDSFLVKDAFKNSPIFSTENDKIVFKRISDNNKELIEKYIPKTKFDDSYPDTTIYKFSKEFQDISFSFSPKLEGGKNKRLIEIIGIYNPIVNSKYKAQLKGRKLSFKMQRIRVENQQEKLLYFNRFKRMIEKLE